ncbi:MULTISPECIES: cytochrome c1 [Undibacterium]|uniref:Cytochrome c1 n=2 Tax=Undibacterium TaxID=401469 RepID=A0A850QHM1_9BURK|nr:MULTISPECIES: cytochrome c1 [Undibacterium]MBC3871107.1 cytochrome c1 [Undibacterium oligocarboniphilum]MBC3885588.1 cytochrome c1 [Undibacterium griseum]NVO76270.1 cytochrome c1 [Undibacterium oligocarboniphilum]
MKLLKKLIAAASLVPALALASGGTFPLDHAPDRTTDMAALQNGAKLFVNYCLNCHSASAMRYNRLRDIGLTEDQIKQNLLFTGEKVGDLMKNTMSPKDAKAWFGAVPPDLSVIARAKASEAGSGADWLYTYLRTYYKDDSRPTGWNNLVFPNVGMPHVLWQLQGVRNAKFVEKKDPHDESKSVHQFDGFEKVTAGSMTAAEYDNAVGDLVAYLQWMGEPAQNTRKRLGVVVLIFMAGLATLAWRLNASFWKEVK